MPHPRFICAPDQNMQRATLAHCTYACRTCNEQGISLYRTAMRAIMQSRGAASFSGFAAPGAPAARHMRGRVCPANTSLLPSPLLLKLKHEACNTSGSNPESAERALYSRVLAPKRTVAPTASCRATFGRIQTPSILVRCAARTGGELCVACKHLSIPCTPRCGDIAIDYQPLCRSCTACPAWTPERLRRGGFCNARRVQPMHRTTCPHPCLAPAAARARHAREHAWPQSSRGPRGPSARSASAPSSGKNRLPAGQVASLAGPARAAHRRPGR